MSAVALGCEGWQIKLGSAWFHIILLIAFVAYREIELAVRWTAA